MNGTPSSERIASFGEWSRYLANSSMMLFYAHQGLLDILSPKLFLNLYELNKTRTFVISDNINAIKNQLQKFNALDAESQKTFLSEQHEKGVFLLTLLGGASICYNQWSLSAEENLSELEQMMTNIDQAKYFSACFEKKKEEGVEQKPVTLVNALNMVFYGVPVNRLYWFHLYNLFWIFKQKITIS